MTESTTREPIASVYYPDEHTGFFRGRTFWLAQHPGVAVSLFVGLFTALQWAGSHWLHELSAPERKKNSATIRGIGRDIRTLATHQLEAQRYNRGVLGDLARAQNIAVERPPELKEAEAQARKLRNR